MNHKSDRLEVTIQGVRVPVVDRGSGPPVLLLHGNPDSAEVWRGVIDRLSERYRCLAPDLPGLGESVTPPDFDYSLDNIARFVDELLAAIGVDQAVRLVVHDFGGPFGLAWAVKHPDKVAGLGIINTVFQSNYRWHFFARIWRTPVLGELSMAMFYWPIFVWAMRHGSKRVPIEYIRHAYSQSTPFSRRMVLRLYRATPTSVFAGREEQLVSLAKRVPAVVLWGDRDPYLPTWLADRFGGQVYHFPDCGHWLPVEAPERVAAILEEHFA